MKVAFLIENLDPRRGGMETSATEFLTEMTALGVDIHVVTQEAPADFSAAPAHRLGRHGWGRAGRYRQFVTRAEEFLSAGKWDIVHAITPCVRCNLYQPRAGFAREAIARTVAVRKNWILRGLRKLGAALNSKQRLLFRLERGLLAGQNPPMVAALSSYMRRQLDEAYPMLSRERVRTVFNGVRVDLPPESERVEARRRLRAELNLRDDEPVCMFVGHNFRRKGLVHLLEAMAMPGVESWRLLVLGKDKPDRYRTYAEQLGIHRRVHFLGSRPDVRQWYLAVEASALPTYYDPCSRTVLESLSLGTPCITTAFDGSADCIENGVQGFVLDSPERTDQLAKALAKLTDRNAREKMAENALALMPYLAMRRHAEQVAEIYHELVKA